MRNDEHTSKDERITLGDTDSLRTTAEGQLAHLDDLKGFRVAEGEPDIRGWDVRTSDGHKIGKVADLLVDTAALKVRYVEVKLEKAIAKAMSRDAERLVEDRSLARDGGARDAGDIPRVTLSQSHDSDDERYALVPIGAARLDDENDDVLLDASAATMAGIPAYDRNALNRDYERDVVRGYTGANPASLNAADNFYTGGPFDDSAFFGTRRGQRDDSYVRREVDRDVDATALGARGDRTDDDRARRTRERDLLDSPDDVDASIRDQINRR